jgi:hypothetical protein
MALFLVNSAEVVEAGDAAAEVPNGAEVVEIENAAVSVEPSN